MTSHSNTAVALDVHALARAYRRVMTAAPGPEPAFSWRLHPFNPSVPPSTPITAKLKGDPDLLSGAAPVMWHNQCRECWGWVDDPRHS